MTLALRYAVRTHVGLVRDKNDDSGYAGPYLLAVADGMGGMPRGDIASAIVIQTVRRLDEPPAGDLEELLLRAITDAKAGIAERVHDEPALEGMGTTLTATLFDGTRVGLAHIGDSRGYLLRSGRFEQITRDHSFVQSLVDEGRITAEEARTHPYRAAVVRVLDGRQDGEPDITLLELAVGDRLLLCSDGLLPSSGAEPEIVHETLAAAETPDQAVADLVRLALEAGAPDNVTCVVGEAVDVPGGPAAVPGGAQVVGAAAALAADEPDARDSTASQEPLVAAGPEGIAPDGIMQDGIAQDQVAAGLGDRDEVEALRYAPQPPARFRWLRRGLVAVVVLALVAGGVLAAYGWTQRQYFVAPYHEVRGDGGGRIDGGYHDSDRVAIYRGISQQFPGVRLARMYEVEGLTLGSLPTYQRRMLAEAISAEDLVDARAVVAQLQDVAAKCASPTGSQGQLTGPARRSAIARDPQIPSECAGVGGATPTPTSTPTPTDPADTPGATPSGTTATSPRPSGRGAGAPTIKDPVPR